MNTKSFLINIASLSIAKQYTSSISPRNTLQKRFIGFDNYGGCDYDFYRQNCLYRGNFITRTVGAGLKAVQQAANFCPFEAAATTFRGAVSAPARAFLDIFGPNYKFSCNDYDGIEGTAYTLNNFNDYGITLYRNEIINSLSSNRITTLGSKGTCLQETISSPINTPTGRAILIILGSDLASRRKVFLRAEKLATGDTKIVILGRESIPKYFDISRCSGGNSNGIMTSTNERNTKETNNNYYINAPPSYNGKDYYSTEYYTPDQAQSQPASIQGSGSGSGSNFSPEITSSDRSKFPYLTQKEFVNVYDGSNQVKANKLLSLVLDRGNKLIESGTVPFNENTENVKIFYTDLGNVAVVFKGNDEALNQKVINSYLSMNGIKKVLAIGSDSGSYIQSLVPDYPQILNLSSQNTGPSDISPSDYDTRYLNVVQNNAQAQNSGNGRSQITQQNSATGNNRANQGQAGY